MTPTQEHQNLRLWACQRFQEGREAAVHGKRRRGRAALMGIGDDFWDFGYRLAQIEADLWVALEELERRERQEFWKHIKHALLAPWRGIKSGIRRLRGLRHEST